MRNIILGVVALAILAGGYFWWQGQTPSMPNTEGSSTLVQGPASGLPSTPTAKSATTEEDVDSPAVVTNPDGSDSPNRFDLGDLDEPGNPGGSGEARGYSQAYPPPSTPTLIVVETIVSTPLPPPSATPVVPVTPPPPTPRPLTPPPPAAQALLVGRMPAGAGVKMRLSRDTFSFTSETNHAGWFAFRVPAGNYQLVIDNRPVRIFDSQGRERLTLGQNQVMVVFVTPQGQETYHPLRVDVLFDKFAYGGWDKLNWSLQLQQEFGPGNPVLNEIFGYFDPAKFVQGRNFTLWLVLSDDKTIRWSSKVWTVGSYGEAVVLGGDSHQSCEPSVELVTNHVTRNLLEIDNIVYSTWLGCYNLR